MGRGRRHCNIAGVSFAVTALAVGLLAVPAFGRPLGRGVTTQATAKKLPELGVTSLGNPPAKAQPGDSFTVTASVKNAGKKKAGASTTRFYLSADRKKSGKDPRLAGTRKVKALAPKKLSRGSTKLTIPSATASGRYYLLACADDLRRVRETNERNNCRASNGSVLVAGPLHAASAAPATSSAAPATSSATPAAPPPPPPPRFLHLRRIRSAGPRGLEGRGDDPVRRNEVPLHRRRPNSEGRRGRHDRSGAGRRPARARARRDRQRTPQRDADRH